MDRREVLRLIAASTGMALIGGAAAAEPAQYPPEIPAFAFSEAEIARLDEVAEIIIPKTDTPGARDAQVGAFMALFVADCYSPAERVAFRNGIGALDRLAAERFGGDFLTIPAEARQALVEDLDAAARAAPGPTPHYFTMMKQLTILGFFTSEIGATEALEYLDVPGIFEDLPLEPGQRAWAT